MTNLKVLSSFCVGLCIGLMIFAIVALLRPSTQVVVQLPNYNTWLRADPVGNTNAPPTLYHVDLVNVSGWGTGPDHILELVLMNKLGIRSVTVAGAYTGEVIPERQDLAKTYGFDAAGTAGDVKKGKYKIVIMLPPRDKAIFVTVTDDEGNITRGRAEIR